MPMLLSLLLSLRAQLNGNHDRVCLATVEPRAPRHERRRLAIADVAEKNSISHVLQGKTPARRTHICQGCPFGPLLVRRTVSDEFDTKEGKNSAYLSLRNLLPQPLLLLAGLGREVLPEIR